MNISGAIWAVLAGEDTGQLPRINAHHPRRDESGNAFVLFLVVLPVVLGAFGIGFDTARNAYVHQSLQNALDMATVAGAARTTTDGHGDVVIDHHAATDTIREIYAYNRYNGPGVSCIGHGGVALPGRAVTMCWVEPNGAPHISATTITYTVREQSRNMFLKLVGVPIQTYTLTSTAQINLRTP